jgi:hypothetical protein
MSVRTNLSGLWLGFSDARDLKGLSPVEAWARDLKSLLGKLWNMDFNIFRSQNPSP